jgi:hypothetical protein
MDQITSTPVALSTYSVLTTSRILQCFGLDLSKLAPADFYVYARILSLPYNNLLNGIILSHAKDFLAFVQKLLIDYFMSSQAKPADSKSDDGSESEDGSGSAVLQSLEREKQALVDYAKTFDVVEIDHTRIIKESQQALKDFVKNLSFDESGKPIIDSDDNMRDKMQAYVKRAEDLRDTAREYRNIFRDKIVSIQNVLGNVQDYHPNVENRAHYMENLDFDLHIGDDTSN